MSDHTAVTRRIWQQFEPIHAVTYFSAEQLAAQQEAGYRGYWMGYFAMRAAPLGPVGPDVVTATFYNFAPAHVRRAIPDAWGFAGPETALALRQRAAAATIERLLAEFDPAAVVRAGSLLRRAAESASPDGRTLFAANRDLDWPDSPAGVLCHAATLLREHRGDGHIAVLVANAIGGRQAGVFNMVCSGYPAGDRASLAMMRQYDDAEIDRLLAELSDRGLVDGESATAAGTALRNEIEATTDRLAATAYTMLDDEELDELVELLGPMRRAVVDSGELPLPKPS